MVMIRIVAGFIKNYNKNTAIKLTEIEVKKTHVKITVKLLIKIEKATMKNGRT